MPNEPFDNLPPNSDDDQVEEARRSLTWLQEGLAISQRVMVVALSLAFPVLVGAGFDMGWPMVPKFPVGMLAGFFFGILAAGWQLWRLTEWLAKKNQATKSIRGAGRPVRPVGNNEEKHRDAPGP
ncbi:MAG: AtpZ/AtpI family protein [Pirellulaceae bacterium]|nr:AtpZ/AtpI family protein [Pirellulaceae bacterium]